MIGSNSYRLTRRMLLMYGFSLGISAARANTLKPVASPVVAWGDSLTAAGYPAIAGGLFSPPRSPINKGLGGQGSYSIAARQGGRPLYVTLNGNMIPARADTVWSWNFDTSTGGWGGLASRSNGKLYVSPVGSPSGASVSLGQTIPNGRAFTVEFDIEIPAGLTVRVGGLSGGVWASNNGAGVNGFNVTASGHYKATLYVGSAGGSPATMDTLAFLMVSGTAGTFTLDNVILSVAPVATDYAVAVTSKNTNILTSGASFTGTAAGTLAGVHGMLSTDSSGNWTFTRDTAGGAVACPANMQFVLDDPALYKNHTAWIWAGNNGVITAADAEATKADIAAMIAYMGHSRFLVLSVLTSTSEDAARVAMIQQLNRDLASQYGHRFVDVYSALLASGNGSPDDNADIAAGLTPRSLRVDAIHLTTAGSTIVAQKVREAMLREGW